MTNVSTKSRNVTMTDPTWPPRVHIDWLGTGDNQVYPGDTGSITPKSGDIRVANPTVSPTGTQGLNLNVTARSL